MNTLIEKYLEKISNLLNSNSKDFKLELEEILEDFYEISYDDGYNKGADDNSKYY